MRSRPSTRRPRWLKLQHQGRTTRVRVWPGQGRPVVLLHGFLDSAQGWDSYCKTTHRPCYALDLPGFGGSSPLSAPSLELYAQAVAQVVEELELSDAILVGHSMGGAVASLLVDQRPQLFTALVLLAPAGFGGLVAAELVNLPVVRDVVANGLPLALMNPLVSGFAYAGGVSGGRMAPLGLSLRLMRSSLRVKRGAQHGLQTLGHLSRLMRTRGFALRESRFEGPVTVLWGGRDRLVPLSHAATVQEAFPHSKLVVWPSMAHHPQVERPQELSRLIEHACARARRERARRAKARRSTTRKA